MYSLIPNMDYVANMKNETYTQDGWYKPEALSMNNNWNMIWSLYNNIEIKYPDIIINNSNNKILQTKCKPVKVGFHTYLSISSIINSFLVVALVSTSSNSGTWDTFQTFP